MLRSILSFAPMFTCAFWFFTLLIDRRHRNRAKKTLAVFMFVACIHFFCQAAFCDMEYRITLIMDPFYTLVTLSVFPLYYLYIGTLTRAEPIRWRSLWIFIPAITISLFSFILYRLMPPQEQNAVLHHLLYREPGSYDFTLYGQLLRFNLRVMDVVFALQILPVAYFGMKKIIEYDKLLQEFYSNQEGKNLAAVKTLLYFFVGTSIISAIFNAIGRYYFVNPLWILLFPSFIFSALLFMLGLAGFRQDFTVDDFKKEANNTEGEKETSQEKGEHKQLMALEARLIVLMEQDELFRNPDLRITDLARQLGTNRTYLSKLINQSRTVSFADFINGYRVEYAKRLLRESLQTQQPVSEISILSGFASEASFYRAFRKHTGISPKSWLGKWRLTEKEQS